MCNVTARDERPDANSSFLRKGKRPTTEVQGVVQRALTLVEKGEW